MRTLKLHFPDNALPTLETFLKQTKEARVFRRAQAVRDVVQGQRLPTVSDTRHVPAAALRKWVDRFAHQGTQGLVDRPRSGRPPHVTGALAHPRNRLVAHDPLAHGSLHSQGNCWERATIFARETGVPRGRARGRGVCKKSPTLRPPHRTTCSRPRCPRLGRGRPRRARGLRRRHLRPDRRTAAGSGRCADARVGPQGRPHRL